MAFTKDPGETELFTFDYINMLAPTETILTASVSVEVESGSDPAPEDMLSGSAMVDSPRVAQMLTGGSLNNIYHVKCTANTSLGQSLIICISLVMESC